MSNHTVIHSDTEQNINPDQARLLLELDWIEPIERNCEITDANIETEDDCTTHGHEQVYQVGPVGLAVSPTGDVDELLSTAEVDFPDVVAAVALTLNPKDIPVSQTNPTFTDLLVTVLSILPDAQLEEDLDGQIVIYTNLTDDPESGTVLGSFNKPQPSLGPVPEGSVRVMVLDDGETYSGLEGCTIQEVSSELDGDGIEDAMRDDKTDFVASFGPTGIVV